MDTVLSMVAVLAGAGAVCLQTTRGVTHATPYSMLGAVITAASVPCVFAGVMNERREEGEDMGVEDKKLCRKTFPAPIYPPRPDFEFHQNFRLCLSRGARFKLR